MRDSAEPFEVSPDGKKIGKNVIEKMAGDWSEAASVEVVHDLDRAVIAVHEHGAMQSQVASCERDAMTGGERA